MPAPYLLLYSMYPNPFLFTFCTYFYRPHLCATSLLSFLPIYLPNTTPFNVLYLYLHCLFSCAAYFPAFSLPPYLPKSFSTFTYFRCFITMSLSTSLPDQHSRLPFLTFLPGASFLLASITLPILLLLFPPCDLPKGLTRSNLFFFFTLFIYSIGFSLSIYLFFCVFT